MKKTIFTLFTMSLFMVGCTNSTAPIKKDPAEIKAYVAKIDKEIAIKKDETFKKKYKKLTKEEQKHVPIYYKGTVMVDKSSTHTTCYSGYDNRVTSRFETKDGEPHGVYKLFDVEEGLKEIGYLEKKKVLSGTVKTFYPSGRLKSELPYYFGKIVGPFKAYYPSGKIKEITAQNYEGANGPSKIYYENGRLEEEFTYVNGKEEGIVTTYFPSGKIETKQSYKKGKKDGDTIYYHENGNVKGKYFYKNGKEEGIFLNYYEDGKLRGLTTFKDGKMDGLSESYYGNGSKEISATWKKGKREGDYYEYNKNGKVIKHLFFVDGKPIDKK